MNNLQLAIHFFLQIAIILLFCRLVGAIALRLGQPQVVAEMLAGVLARPIPLRPSVARMAAMALPLGQGAKDS